MYCDRQARGTSRSPPAPGFAIRSILALAVMLLAVGPVLGVVSAPGPSPRLLAGVVLLSRRPLALGTGWHFCLFVFCVPHKRKNLTPG